jgi:hypothetical protein
MALLLFLLSCVTPNKNTELQSNSLVSVTELLLICEENKEETCKIGASFAKGTATRVRYGTNYYWLTAGHVCTSVGEIQNSVTVKRKVLITIADSGEKKEFEEISYNLKKDLCAIKAEKGPARDLAIKNPNKKDHVYTVAYPSGAFDKDVFPMYEGRWAGFMKDQNKCLTSIPVAGGSSGAAVLNSRDEVVGVVSSVMKNFNHFSLIVCLDDVRDFLKVIDSEKQ